jgi:NAD(P)-dependent dehydrogenase (short-subunit alcohol dehydrogenase family)
MRSLDGARILVVGASSGIGRATAELAAGEGARVALAARRTELLDEIASALPGAVTIACDVRDEAACARAVDEAADALGGLDAVAYVAGATPIGLLSEPEDDQWARAFETNVFGAVAVARAALPHLRATDGRIVFVSSNAAERPWPGMVAYAASKAALDTFVAGWRHEVPEVGATRLVCGPTMTSMSLDWDPELAGRLRPRWVEGGYLAAQPQVQQAEDVGRQILNAICADTRVSDVRVVPPGV